MSTPKGMKCTVKTLADGKKVLIYSDAERIIFQVRHQVPTELNLLEPSFKVAVLFTPAEAIVVASELLNAALPQLARLQASTLQFVDDEVSLTEEGDSVEGD